MKLTNKVAIITGGGRGLGKAFSIGFAKEGADVVVCDRDEGGLEAVAGEIRSLGRRCLVAQADVRQESEVSSLVQKAINEFGHIDVLVNNAGVADFGPITELSSKRWELVLGVNLTGTFNCVKAVLPKMIEQRSGSIINISSFAADRRCDGPIPTGIAYRVSKSGLERFTYILAAQLGKYNIAVNAVKPVRVVDTEGMRANMPAADRAQWDPPDRMVKCAVFLAGQDASGVTGVVAIDEELCEWHGLK